MEAPYTTCAFIVLMQPPAFPIHMLANLKILSSVPVPNIRTRPYPPTMTDLIQAAEELREIQETAQAAGIALESIQRKLIAWGAE